MTIPKDPLILLSFINTQLRDKYSSLDELCSALMLDVSELTTKLATIDYKYNPQINQFK